MAELVLNEAVEPFAVYTFFSTVTVPPLLPPPVTLIVFVAPVPEAVTPDPVKFNVVAAVDIVEFVENVSTCGDSVECVCDGTNWFAIVEADASGAMTMSL